MKQRYALSVLVILLAGCSASHIVSPIAALPGAPGFAPQGVVDPFILSKGNVIHKFALPSGSVPVYMATGSDKNVWYTQDNGGHNAALIGMITPSGVTTHYAIPSGFEAVDIAAGAPGTLWFTEASPGSQTDNIGKVTTSGHVTEFPVATGDYFDSGIAKGPDGNMWFTASVVGKIGKITPTGVVTEYPVTTTQGYPMDIAAGPDGNLWFTEFLVGQIGKITTAGVVTEYPACGSDSQIAEGPDGNLYASTGGGIERITTSGVVTCYNSSTHSWNDIVTGPDKQMWLTGGYVGGSPAGLIQEFSPKTQTFTPFVQLSGLLGGLTDGGDGDVWIADSANNAIDVYEEKLTTIGIRLNGEMSLTDPTYGFELGYAAGTGTQTQTISLNMGESVQFKNLDTIPHTAAFLGNASPSPSTWPATFTGGTTKSPAFTAIGTTGFSTGNLNANQKSLIYETGAPGFYMIGCQYHYVSNMLRTVVIVH